MCLHGNIKKWRQNNRYLQIDCDITTIIYTQCLAELDIFVSARMAIKNFDRNQFCVDLFNYGRLQNNSNHLYYQYCT